MMMMMSEVVRLVIAYLHAKFQYIADMTAYQHYFIGHLLVMLLLCIFQDNHSEDEREREQRDRDKQARVEASLREREKEVQRTLATHMRDRDKEREQHKHDEAVQHFNALLADLVSNYV